MHAVENKSKNDNVGYLIGVLGVSLVLAWIGIYKFTPTEAKLIQPLVENHFAMSWLYNVISVQAVSNIIGATEIVVAIGLIIGIKNNKIAYLSGIAAALIFVTTLSFLLTTPNTWKVSDGVLVTNFFLVKDILFLAISVSVIERNKPSK
ncbi:YkgB family protein [Vibrio ordalii]|uniref:YkgB family protein n=1 Tax=Vibrio ordalii TaxID=28174 RepID=UPI0025770203|nr:YkgB family protein [Vibrio ordalii]MCS0352815.1 YkgB family protein [Vibrio ordalii]